jgi:hypothetical protein
VDKKSAERYARRADQEAQGNQDRSSVSTDALPRELSKRGGERGTWRRLNLELRGARDPWLGNLGLTLGLVRGKEERVSMSIIVQQHCNHLRFCTSDHLQINQSLSFRRHHPLYNFQIWSRHGPCQARSYSTLGTLGTGWGGEQALNQPRPA